MTALEAEKETLRAERQQVEEKLSHEKAQSKGWLDALTAETQRLKAGPSWEQVEALKSQVDTLLIENQRLKLKGQASVPRLVADAPPVLESLQPMHERAEAALLPVRKRVVAAKEDVQGGTHTKAALPDGLRAFTPLAHESDIRKASDALGAIPCLA